MNPWWLLCSPSNNNEENEDRLIIPNAFSRTSSRDDDNDNDNNANDNCSYHPHYYYVIGTCDPGSNIIRFQRTKRTTTKRRRRRSVVGIDDDDDNDDGSNNTTNTNTTPTATTTATTTTTTKAVGGTENKATTTETTMMTWMSSLSERFLRTTNTATWRTATAVSTIVFKEERQEQQTQEQEEDKEKGKGQRLPSDDDNDDDDPAQQQHQQHDHHAYNDDDQHAAGNNNSPVVDDDDDDAVVVGIPILFHPVKNHTDIACILHAYKLYCKQRQQQQQERRRRREEQEQQQSTTTTSLLQDDDDDDAEEKKDSTHASDMNTDTAGSVLMTTPTTPTTTILIDRMCVENDVLNGTAPSLCPSRSLIQQIVLKHCMNIIFNRYSVCHFSAAPYRYSSRCYWDIKKYPAVKGYVALTIDDAPCRFESRTNSRLLDVLNLLDEYNHSKVTFMMIGKYMDHIEHRCDMIDLIQRGHEMANHGMYDRPYHLDTEVEFATAVDECNARIHTIQKLANDNTTTTATATGSSSSSNGNTTTTTTTTNSVRWFRAPHGKYTKRMETVLKRRNMYNVMCDTYSSCPIIEDGIYIGKMLSERATHGSIILLHMPEYGNTNRDHCYIALKILLHKLTREKNMKIVTVSMLHDIVAQNSKTTTTTYK